MVLGLLGIIYGALVAMVQPDIKKLVAYSSVSQDLRSACKGCSATKLKSCAGGVATGA